MKRLSHNPMAPRTGATLTEILMSIMIMGIGLTAVASLFPLTMVRSMQATQLTNAAILQYQFEDTVRAFPTLAYMDHDETYSTPSDLIPNRELTTASVRWSGGIHVQHTYDGTRAQLLGAAPHRHVSVIDPIGQTQMSLFGLERRFGNDSLGLVDSTTGAANPLFNELSAAVDRKNGGLAVNDPVAAVADAATRQAYQFFASRDSWSPYFHSGGSISSSVVTFDTTEISIDDMNELISMINSNIPARLIVLDLSLKRTIVRPIAVSNINAAARTLNYSAEPIILRNGFTPIEFWVETFEPRYTSLLTVRRDFHNLGPGPSSTYGITGVDDDGNGTVDNFNELGWNGTDDIVRNVGADLVVFFRRSFEPAAEQVYEVFNMRKYASGAVPPKIAIRWGDESTRPRIKAGGFVFDPTNGYWYKIREVLIEQKPVDPDEVINAASQNEAIITLDRPPVADTFYVMLPPNVVEVFPFNLPAEE